VSDHNDGHRRAVDARITRVVVYEDRAEVTREVDVELPVGSAVVVVRGVSALVSDKHVVARVVPAVGEAFVNDVRVERRIEQVTSSLAQRRALTFAEVEALDDAIDTAKRTLEDARRQRTALDASARTLHIQLARAAGEGLGDVEEWQRTHSAITNDLQRAGAAVHAARVALTDAMRARQEHSGAVPPPAVTSSKPPPPPRAVADLVLRVQSEGGPAHLIVQTLLPCAAWRPMHEAHLLDDGTRVRFETHASVWQKTGESWDDVTLTLSTERPSGGAQVPTLDEDRLALRDKTAQERKVILVEHRDEEVPKSASEGSAPGVDDGGEPRVFRVEHAHIVDDGRPARVTVGSFTAPCTSAHLAMPDVSTSVFLRASFRNAGAVPVLAGPVTLLQDGAYVGVGDVLFVGVDETLDLGFGANDQLRLRMERTTQLDKKTLGKDVTHFIRTCTLQSVADVPMRVQVRMRMPVSEVKQVRVLPSTHLCTHGVPTPDESGMVQIPVDLLPGSTRVVALAFSFDTTGDVRMPDPW
jgi:uncharacterized protein (TIGR02231 family)